jgi:hypothetical protein
MRTSFPLGDVLSVECGHRLVGAVSGRGVCGRIPIFLQGISLRPEECNKLTRPLFASICTVVVIIGIVANHVSCDEEAYSTLAVVDCGNADRL